MYVLDLKLRNLQNHFVKVDVPTTFSIKVLITLSIKFARGQLCKTPHRINYSLMTRVFKYKIYIFLMN